MPWKIPWKINNRPPTEGKGNFYSLLRSDIGEIRRQGDHPVKDGDSFSRYICDLCHRTTLISTLRQCVICGRWACPDCWKDEYYVCSSCSGVIRLHLVEIPEKENPSDRDLEEPEREISPENGDNREDILV
jgi:hypothetical protein